MIGRTKLSLLVLLATIAIAAGGAGPRPGHETQRRRSAFDDVAASTDVAFLEQLVVSFETARAQPVPGGLRGKPKTLRTVALARLGELGTAESLAAARRIEARARTVVPAPPIVPMGVWTHPSWHFGDIDMQPVAQVAGDDGVTYGIVVSSMMGAVDLFLVANATPDDPATWSRPKLIPLRYYRGFHDPALAPAGDGKLLLRYVQDEPPARRMMEGTRDLGAEAPALGEQERVLDIGAIERDTDRDGWTDIEEERLGLDPRDADSDGDGIIDGQDVTPNFAPPAELADDLEARLMAKALFATFGLSGSRYLLLVQPDRPRLDVWGYAGPVIFGVERADWTADKDHGAVWMNWRVESIDDDTATVIISDWEGVLAAGSQYVELLRIDGVWYVVGWRMGSVA
jgi:hypothetical protein